MNALRAIKSHWLEKIRLGLEYKRKHFQDDADECMRFYNGPAEHLFGLRRRRDSGGLVFAGDEGMPRPSMCMTVNKAAEVVQLFGPVLYHRNPYRQVNPRVLPGIPEHVFAMAQQDQLAMAMTQQMAQQVDADRSMDRSRAGLLEYYLNYTPTALDLKSHARKMIDEALIKGMGILWHEVYQPKGASFRLAGSFWDTVDNLVIDPDAEKLDDAKWLARRRVRPVWEVEAEFGLPPGTLRGNVESSAMQAAISAGGSDGDYQRKRGLTNDLVTYWQVYSKMGLGSRLHGISQETRELDVYGDNIMLAITEETNFPLNMSPDALADINQAAQAIQWETPFWADAAWPCTMLAFHDVPRNVWPMAHLKPAMGELKFLQWAYSFIASKISISCRDFIAVAKSAAEEIKQAIRGGADLELIEIEKAHGTITEVVQFLQHPQFNGDIWKVIEAIEANFEKRVGLTELMYGESARQMRSASEAQVKADQLRVRPDDMANKVEDAMTEVARREALAARWNLDQQDVAPVMGQVGAYYWSQLVSPADPSALLHQLEYRIEAGSIRKPNRDRDLANANAAMQTVFQPVWQLAMQTGQVGPANAVLEMWAKANDMDPAKFQVQPPPPPMPPEQPPAAAAPPAEGQAA